MGDGQKQEAYYEYDYNEISGPFDKIPVDDIQAHPEQYLNYEYTENKTDVDSLIKRIEKRGRDYELIEKDPSLVDYYQRLLKHYDIWMKEYDASPLLIIDGDKYDFMESKEDRVQVLETVENKLLELGNISEEQFEHFKKKHQAFLN